MIRTEATTFAKATRSVGVGSASTLETRNTVDLHDFVIFLLEPLIELTDNLFKV